VELQQQWHSEKVLVVPFVDLTAVGNILERTPAKMPAKFNTFDNKYLSHDPIAATKKKV
jgi:hypothetical protein